MSLPPHFPSPWEQIRIKFRHPNMITVLLQCSGINEVVDSQASLTQLIQGKVNLVALVLHPPETAMMNDGLIQQIAVDEQTRYINLRRIGDIGTGDIYFQMLNEELENLSNNLSHNGKNLRIINSISQYNAADTNTVHAVLIIEGPHAFFGPRRGIPEAEIYDTFWRNFEKFTDDNKIFSLNIAHLQENDFCNHAFGIQIFKPRPFYPYGTGITEHGIKLLRRMNEKRIMLDIKHMSLFARTQLYSMRTYPNLLPMVCTHAGLTGIKMPDRGRFIIETRNDNDHLWVRHYKRMGYLSGTSFNPSSINLYDEDVREIVFSGGMIGLSLDQRILGTPEEWMMSIDNMGDIFEQEVFSPGEKDFFTDIERSTPHFPVIMVEDISNADRQDWPRFHARHFLNQVFHLFLIAEESFFNKAVMAERICIGSDFDGMINPIDCCRNVTRLEHFKNYLVSNFTDWEEEFTAKTGIRISSFISPQKLMDNIFYNNGLNFLRQWFN